MSHPYRHTPPPRHHDRLGEAQQRINSAPREAHHTSSLLEPVLAISALPSFSDEAFFFSPVKHRHGENHRLRARAHYKQKKTKNQNYSHRSRPSAAPGRQTLAEAASVWAGSLSLSLVYYKEEREGKERNEDLLPLRGSVSASLREKSSDDSSLICALYLLHKSKISSRTWSGTYFQIKKNYISKFLFFLK
jgi:hypothetical protein